MMHTEAALESMHQKVARILAKQYNIRVVIGGSRAYVDLDKREIHLPGLADRVVQRLGGILDGFNDHEIAHVHHTENIFLPETTPQWIANALEDCRVDKLMGQAYPGAKVNLEKLHQALVDLAQDKWHKLDDFNKVMFYMVECWRHRQAHADCTYDPDVGDLLAQLLPEVEAGWRVQSTRDVQQVALQVWEKIKKLAENKPAGGGKPEAGDQGAGPAGQQGTEGPGGADNEQGEDSDDSDGDQDDGGPGGDQPNTKSGDDTEPGNGQDSATGTSESTPQAQSQAQSILDADRRGTIQKPIDAESLIAMESNDIDSGSDGPLEYMVFSEEYDTEVEYSHKERAAHSQQYKDLKDSVRSYTGVLSTHLEAALLAETEARWVGGAPRGRRFDRKRLVNWVMGGEDTNFWKYLDQGERLDTAVTMLWDCSGSMGPVSRRASKSSVARLAAIAFHEALLRVEIPHEVLGFNTGGSVDPRLEVAVQAAKDRGDDLARYSRLDKQDNRFVFVPFGQRDGRAICRISGGSANRDGECVLWSAKRLAARPETRKILIVGSDGQPAGARFGGTEKRYLRHVVQRIMRAGIEVYGIGIKNDAVKSYYPEYVVIHDIQELPRAVMGTLYDKLVNRKGLR